MEIEKILFQAEANAARLERTIVRLWVLLIILLFLIVGTNFAWFYYESQFEDVSTTVTQELDATDGGKATINDGVHINGESKADGNNEKKSP